MCMAIYKIKIYPTAQQDFRDIITLSPDTALRYYDLLTEKIASLAQSPERCPHPRDLALTAKGYRYLIVQNYLVFYIVNDDTVQIHRILYNRRNYSALL